MMPLKEKTTENKLIFRDVSSSELTGKEFLHIQNKLEEIIKIADLDSFKDLAKEYAEYGEEKNS